MNALHFTLLLEKENEDLNEIMNVFAICSIKGTCYRSNGTE